MSNNVFYIVVKPRNSNNVTVVDISYNNIDDKYDYNVIIDHDYEKKDEAIESAIRYARSNKLNYIDFESRYC
jgi:hypothetical protein